MHHRNSLVLSPLSPEIVREPSSCMRIRTSSEPYLTRDILLAALGSDSRDGLSVTFQLAEVSRSSELGAAWLPSVLALFSDTRSFSARTLQSFLCSRSPSMAHHYSEGSPWGLALALTPSLTLALSLSLSLTLTLTLTLRHFAEQWSLGGMSDRWSVFQPNTQTISWHRAVGHRFLRGT